MRQLDYAELQEKYGDKYMATRDTEVVASAETLGELAQILAERNVDDGSVVFRYVRPKDEACAYWVPLGRGPHQTRLST